MENCFNFHAGTEEVFDTKGIILKYIDRVPGIRYRELLRLTGLVNGTLEYNQFTGISTVFSNQYIAGFFTYHV